ncbi:putative DNA-binding domain-containing protein [Undibacterium sp. RuTC16W]|uniref:HvfC/BufC family peptide modification chaperone n=1 Tax=Undibacterium sp. RuTC16W TaxID=3413048 RepID=UPI003BF167F2
MTANNLAPLNPAHKTTLTELQLRFSERLMATASASELDSGLPVELNMFGGKPAQITSRLATYRGNLTAIWSQALKNVYPVLYQLVGEEFFGQMAREYGRRHPSTSGDLNEFGVSLATFLEDEELGVSADYPYFPDVARLEWLVHQAYYAEDKSTLHLSALISRFGAEFADASLELHPSCKLIVSDWASADIWLAHQNIGSGVFPSEIQHKNHILIHRQNWTPAVHVIDAASYAALRALSQGINLGQSLEVAVECDAGFLITERLQQWFQWELFCSDELNFKELL